jgi:hypothetical protein
MNSHIEKYPNSISASWHKSVNPRPDSDGSLSFRRMKGFNWSLITFQLDGKRSTIGRYE